MRTSAGPLTRTAALAALFFTATSSSAVVGGPQSPLSDAAFMGALLSQFEYREIGPTRQGGRVVAFGVSAQRPKTFYVGPTAVPRGRSPWK